ncbi:MAG: arabinan endo-1,5-alpha-L-arabinosidase [Bacteroidales bacterium]|nr:arabinan endo-1,5-alpha-L-arabinosidase [Bacteroidales bacterium]
MLTHFLLKQTTGLNIPLRIVAGTLAFLLSNCQQTDFKDKYKEYDPGIKDDYSDIWEVKNYKKWGVYNVHDPSCIKVGEYYYIYSTDAIYFKERPRREDFPEEMGYIQVRKSKDLIHWDFVGWAFDSIPIEAIEHIRKASGGGEPRNIWAPYIFEYNGEYRLYYAVSLFGAKTSYLGLAISDSPEGPWKQSGCVVKTDKNDLMNAIDPSVIKDNENGHQWMHYGSYFGGLYCVELDPNTGLTINEGDKGHLIARRADYKRGNLEAPEIIYNKELDKYYLFTSYDALFTHYNVRVGRSDRPEGPFTDYFGKNLADTANNYPVLTYAYRFSGHPGWAGVGHCAVLNDSDYYFMLHQGRLAPDNVMMVLHVRKMFWTTDGWPVVSPERFADLPQDIISKKEIIGKWEIIELNEIADSVILWQGQIPPGGWKYDTTLFNNFKMIELNKNGSVIGYKDYTWKYKDDRIWLEKGEDAVELIVGREWDWEKGHATIVFSGIKKDGTGIYGKKI